MKKRIALALLTSLLLGLAGTVQAGNGYHRHHDRYPGGYERNFHGHHSGYNNRRHRHDDDDFGRGLAIVAGAVVLGTIIHAINHNSSRNANSSYQARAREPNDRYEPPAQGQDYWYRVDQNGDCVLVRLNQQGREIWSYADPSYCR